MRRLPTFVLPLLLLTGLLASLLACDDANPVAPSGTTLNVTATPTLIGLNGESLITVTGFEPDGGRLNPGTLIRVTTDLGNLFFPGSSDIATIIEADSNGQAFAVFRADGRTGQATVTASLVTSSAPTGGGGEGGGGGGAGGSSFSATVQVGEPEETRPTLVISANPTIIAVGTTSEIDILGRASDGTALGAGQRIRISSDLGRVVERGGNENSPSIDELFTDSNGEADATFVAGDRGGTGRVAAIVGTSEEVMVDIQINAALESIFLTASQNTVNRDPNGVMITFTATLQDVQGEPLTGTIVNFFSDRGSFDNTAVPSNTQGQARAILTVRSIDVQDILQDGTFAVNVRATSEGVTKEDTVLLTVLGPP